MQLTVNAFLEFYDPIDKEFFCQYQTPFPDSVSFVHSCNMKSLSTNKLCTYLCIVFPVFLFFFYIDFHVLLLFGRSQIITDLSLSLVDKDDGLAKCHSVRDLDCVFR